MSVILWVSVGFKGLSKGVKMPKVVTLPTPVAFLEFFVKNAPEEIIVTDRHSSSPERTYCDNNIVVARFKVEDGKGIIIIQSQMADK
ncbi:hypothetical protein A2382_03000 [Candidatus Woesebacteria bacterium RIFOXYB1_FULL_38_16]|uniref:Uncharacterized protein n=1 Tax=Candidatus Woesebacteria bacterium RIFOXYB1_FULL_38_16 TaxID=1802538 RepID=A0A1F8CS83_9BACT|nr:MAG: hypothetical protein A2191_04600 [Candidatus Woesebacteria bacterium RIFOXYA1_FULL_38_9]OGM79174.1 MAG: hypothetical protein A2382_03000 [Candidatus Woesebacteria bacterium RIFOXYB1_FULL_38_16]